MKRYLVFLFLLITNYISSQTVVDIIVNSPSHNTLETAVIAAGLDDDLQGEGPFTVFAPTDEAFAALPAGTLEALLNDIPTLTQILTYHVASGSVLSSDLNDGQRVTTLQGRDITVTINAEGVFINDAQVTLADIQADNGVVHVIDAVLLPPTATNTVVDVIVNSENHNTLEAAVLAAGLEGVLSGEGPFTVFAPTDEAFAALPAGTLEALLNDIPTLTQILTYHVAGGSVLSSDLNDGQRVTTLQGRDITVTINAEGVFINDAQVTLADIQADNGVVHVIDAVLLPPTATNTVVDVIVNSENHNTLEAAVLAAGLEGVLSGEGPFTVFAPTDEAFAALPAGTLEALLNDIPTLTQILTYHVAGGSVLSSDLNDGQRVTTLQGRDITVTINAEGVFINDAQVTLADIQADNGVVHVIDAVLLPPTATTVFDIIADSDQHTTLELAIRTAELAGDLSNVDAEFTIFAPTDEAFAVFPDSVITALLQNKELLADVLLYHATSDYLDSENIEFIESGYALMLNGKTATLKSENDTLFINDIPLRVVDIIADNGIVHVLDAVLLAPDSTIIDVVRNSPAHTILEQLLDVAEFSQPLEGYGPFTLFAPTDAAISALPQELIDELTTNPDLLSEVLAYHVVSGTALSADLSNNQEIQTLLFKNIKVTINNEGVFINNARVILADIKTGNGVVHVLDAVLIPPTTVNDVIFQRNDMENLNLLLFFSGLDITLNGDGPFTVFAPNDEAFENAPSELLDYATENLQNLNNLLLFHVAPVFARSSDLTNGQSIITANGKTLLVTINNDGVFINNAKVIEADLEADNGVVHVIDQVLDITTSVQEWIENPLFLYPNPTADFIQFDGLDVGQESLYFITDNQNRIIKQGRMDGSQQISVQDLMDGQYVILIQDGKKVYASTFVKVF